MCRLALCGGGGAALADELSPSQSGSAINLNKLSPSQSGLASNQSTLNPSQSGLATSSNKLNPTQPTLAFNSNKPTQSYLASNQSKLNPSLPSDKLNSNELNLALSQNEQALKQSSLNKDLQGALLADASDSIGQAIEQSAQATADSAPQTYQLEQTVITATGYEQEAKYAPASISIVPKEEITSRPIKDLGDIVQDVPGVSVDVFKTGVSTIAIRGMHPEYTLTLVDGKRISPSKGIDSNYYNQTAGSIPPVSMIERVEVIKGPASLRYGSEAMGGVINIITKKVPDKTTASIGLEARLQEHHSTWGNNYGFNGTIYHPINEYFSVNLRGKINYGEKNHIYWKGASGYICNPTTQNAQCANPYAMQSPSDYNNANVGGRLIFTPNEQNTFYVDTDFNWQRIGTLNSSPRQMGEYRDYERFNVLLNHDGEYDFGAINTYVQFNSVSKIDNFYNYYGTNKDTYKEESYSHGRNHATLIYNPTISAASTFTKNLDLGKAGALIVNAGPSYIYERLYDRENQTDEHGYQVAVFGEGEYLPLDWLGVVAGVRLNYVNVQGLYAAPRAYLSFYPMSWLTLKMGFASGFQVPDLDMRYDGLYEIAKSTSTNVYYYGNKDLKMEKTYNYEVSALIDSPFANFSLTGYVTDYRDAIDSETFLYGESISGYVCENNTAGTSPSSSPTCSINVNVDKARLIGAEFAMNSKALLSSLFTKYNGGIYVDLSYAYTDTERLTGSDEGKPLNDIPLHTITGKLSYKTPSWQLYTRYRGTLKKPVHNTLVARYLTAANIATYGKYPDYYKDLHIVDLGTSYRFKNGITLGFVINNLLDKDTTGEYFTYGDNAHKNAYEMHIPGRNYWLNLSADF